MGLLVSEQPLRSGDDSDAQAAEYLRQGGGLGVNAKSGLADTTDASDRTLAVLAVLEGEGQGLADLALLGFVDLIVGDVALG